MAEALAARVAPPPSQGADQASGLRRLLGKQTIPLIAFASARAEAVGTGGRYDRMSDRIRLMLLFADEFARAGRRVAMLDEHPAPGGVTSAYGVESRRDIKHVLQGNGTLESVMLDASPGIAVIPAARTAGMELDVADAAALAGNIQLLKSRHDCVMVDCVHRAQRALSPIARQADRIVLVVAANGDDLMSSYALIKRMTMEQDSIPMSIIVAHATTAGQARATFDRLHDVAFNHLGIHMRYLGAAFTPGVRRPSLMTAVCGGRMPDPVDASRRDSLFPALMPRDSVV